MDHILTLRDGFDPEPSHTFNAFIVIGTLLTLHFMPGIDLTPCDFQASHTRKTTKAQSKMAAYISSSAHRASQIGRASCRGIV